MDYKMLMPRAYCSSVEVLNLTATLCKKAIEDNVPGDFAEAGVGFGVHGVVMNDCAKGTDKRVWLYDSFEGISLHGPEDKEWTDVHGVREKSDPRKSGGITVCTPEQVGETIWQAGQSLSNFFFVKGWFLDTLPKIPAHIKFSVLRLDCDLYDPYMTCFRFLLPRLSFDGWIIIDDWVLSGCKKAIVDSGLEPEWFTVTKDNMAYLQWTMYRKHLWRKINLGKWE